MAQQYVEASGSSTTSRIVSQLIQLSDGTDAWVELDGTGANPAVKYSADHVTVGSIAAVGFTPGTPYSRQSFAISCDASDNIYVVSFTSTGLHGQAFIKGTGHSWTAGAAMNYSGIGGTDPADAVWCNTGGGTSNAGHVVVVVFDHLYALDAGVMLAGTGTLFVSASGTLPAIGSRLELSPDGFGATSGQLVDWNAGTASIYCVAWSITSGGTVSVGTSHTVSLGSTPIGMVRLIRYGSGQWVLIAASTSTSAGHYMAWLVTSSGVSTGVDSGAPTNMPLNSAHSTFDAFLDPTTANQVWVIAVGTVSGSNATVYRLACALGSGTPVWSSTTTTDDTLTNAYAVSNNSAVLDACKQPRSTVASWRLFLQTAATPTYAIDGDYTSFATAPSAPTLLSPSNGAYLDTAAGLTFTATYNSTDSANANAYAFRVKVDGGAYSYYNAGTNSLQSSIVWNACSVAPGDTLSASLPAAALADGHVDNWSFAAQEAIANLQGPFASDWTLNAQTPPSVTVAAPGGTQSLAQPIVTWTASPATGASVTNYRVVVYSAAQYGAGGFSPGTSAATWDSGTLSGNPGALQIGTVLANSTAWRAYVQVTESGGETSAWTYSAFTTSFDAPATPTLTAVAGTDPKSGAPTIVVTVQGHDNYLSANQSSAESGATTGWSAGANTTLDTATSWAADGAYAFTMTATTSGAVSMTTPTGTSGFAVTPGQWYSAMVELHASAAGQSGSVGIAWYNSSGTLLSSSTGTGVSVPTVGGAQATVQAQAPAGAAYAAVSVNGSGLAASGVLSADQVGFMPGQTTAWSIGGNVGATAAEVQYSLDGGATWQYPAVAAAGAPVSSAASSAYPAGTSQDVRGASALTLPSPSQLAAVTDYEVTPGLTKTYRAIVSNPSTGLVGAASTTASATPSASRWWVVDPLDPSTAYALKVKAHTELVTEQLSNAYAMGAQLPSVNADVVNGEDGTLQVETTTVTDKANVKTLARLQRVLWLSSPTGDGLYVRIGPAGPSSASSTQGQPVRSTTVYPSTAATPYTVTALQYVEVAKP